MTKQELIELFDEMQSGVLLALLKNILPLGVLLGLRFTRGLPTWAILTAYGWLLTEILLETVQVHTRRKKKEGK